MFANLLKACAGAGAAKCHRNVTETTCISLQRLLFPLHHCDIHELELELDVCTSMDGCANWMNVSGAGCVTRTTLSIQTLLFPLVLVTSKFLLLPSSRYSDVTGMTPISLQTVLFPLHQCDIHLVWHGIHIHIMTMTHSPVLQLSLGSVQGRAGPEQLDIRHEPARSVQTSKRALIGSISTSTQAGMEPELLSTRTGHHQVEPTW